MQLNLRNIDKERDYIQQLLDEKQEQLLQVQKQFSAVNEQITLMKADRHDFVQKEAKHVSRMEERDVEIRNLKGKIDEQSREV